MEEHRARVERISHEIATFRKTASPFRIYHGSTNSTRPSSKTHRNTVDISDLKHVIMVDVTKRTCLAEPNVSMDVLLAAALKHNLVPPVVPEFPAITVGGAYAGTAGESSSFRHGFFDDCVGWAEIILADGKIVVASETENADLFHGTKGTFGTLGVGTLFEIKLVEAKKFVRVRYDVVSGGIDQAKSMMKAACVKDYDEVHFVDGIMFSSKIGVIMVGTMTDADTEVDNELSVVTFSKPSDNWFYLHAQDIMTDYVASKEEPEKLKTYKDLIPLTDYLFRYDRGGFWTGTCAFEYFLTPFNKATRWMLDNFMHTKTMYHALHRSGLIQNFITQDMAVPWRNVEPFFTWLDQNVHIYPLWLAPLKMGRGGIKFNPKFEKSQQLDGQKQDLLLNFGVWGFPPQGSGSINRDIEAKLAELSGMKWLYSQTFYTEDEFWNIYDQIWYKQLRTAYHAETLPDIYEKVGGTALNKRNALTGIWRIWPLAGIYGVLSVLKGGDYLRKG